MVSNPPFQEAYENLLKTTREELRKEGEKNVGVVEECELPLIDLGRLLLDEEEREKCKEEIADASSTWGFFQVLNHGISKEMLAKIRGEQVKVFQEPFEKKANERLSNFSPDSYRWGSPNATSPSQFSWSEAFHIPLTMESEEGVESNSLRSTILEFASAVSDLAHRIAQILEENLGNHSSYFVENCSSSTCYLRLNRYPPCPVSSGVFGLMPHTDSDFLTIVYQDQVGGLQLLKDGRWIMAKPIPEALVVNIGDLLEAWSNRAYKSVQHRVMTNTQVERFSAAYFMCPSHDTVIESYTEPSVYKRFTFREFRQQVQEDVRTRGCKIGLPRFLI